MRTSRRVFFGKIGQTAGGMVAAGVFTQTMCRRLEALVLDNAHVPPAALASDELFWGQVQRAYTTDRSLIHLNNGGVSPSPRTVQEALKRYLDHSNQAPSLTMWKQLQPNIEHVRRKLARLAGVDPEEVAITRNATESLENIIFGLDFEPGDEILTTTQDYPSMLASWEQRALRYGVGVRKVKVPTPPPDMDALVGIFRKAITDRTRLIMVSHMVNLTGQIFPIREICDLAHSRGIEVLVDGAHTFAHMDFKIRDLDCDYFGTSLHKWLSAPFGTGMLYVKREKISKIWPLFGHEKPRSDDIKKFERIGTHPVANFLAIGEAINFQHALGSRRKEERLRYLKNYWAERALQIPGVRLNTLLDPKHSCGLANVTVDGKDPAEDIARPLMKKYRIVVTPIKHEECTGVRVTPHVYTSLDELDMFVDALKDVLTA